VPRSGLKLLGYVRVSTAEQAASGLGLEAQERSIEDTCRARDWELLDLVRDEGASGKTLERPGLERVLRRIAAGEADGLVVAKLDRLSRSVIDFGLLLEWFTEADATLVALDLGVDTSTPGGRLVANVIASVAEWERDTIADRTRAGLASLRAQGKPTGRAAVADRPELTERIRVMREVEGLTLQAIADRLNAEGVPTARGAATWRSLERPVSSGLATPPQAAQHDLAP
jgi:DNA invertase Pin-like site-specific DNA recombinase